VFDQHQTYKNGGSTLNFLCCWVTYLVVEFMHSHACETGEGKGNTGTQI